MTYSSKQDILSQFVVIQDGALNEALIADNEKLIRNTMIREYTAEIGATCARMAITGLVAAARFAGSTTLLLFEAAAEEGRK